MYPYRMTTREYQDLVAEALQAQREKRQDSKPKSGLRPTRRPVDHNGHKLQGRAYRDWLEAPADQG